MENLLLKYPQIDGVWADSGLQGSGAAEAFLDAQMDVPPITGEDFNRFLKMWKEQGLNAIAVDYTVRQGYEAVQVALDILKGEPVPHYVLVPNTVITQDNLDQFVRTDLPDDYWAGSMPQVTERLFP
jgi:ribose transport system substrate-binding protein